MFSCMVSSPPTAPAAVSYATSASKIDEEEVFGGGTGYAGVGVGGAGRVADGGGGVGPEGGGGAVSLAVRAASLSETDLLNVVKFMIAWSAEVQPRGMKRDSRPRCCGLICPTRRSISFASSSKELMTAAETPSEEGSLENKGIDEFNLRQNWKIINYFSFSMNRRV
jgi:hypothetical protein